MSPTLAKLNETPMSDVTADPACRDLLIRLCRHLDAGELDRVAAFFADDGVWHRQGLELVGPAQVREALSRRAPGLKTQHLVMNMVLDKQDNGEVEARYSTIVYAEMPDKPFHLHNVFLSTDRLRTSQDGWRIISRKAVPAFAT